MVEAVIYNNTLSRCWGVQKIIETAQNQCDCRCRYCIGIADGIGIGISWGRQERTKSILGTILPAWHTRHVPYMNLFVTTFIL
jgi:hypothetical protein